MSVSLPTDAIILNVDDSEGARYSKTRILSNAGFVVIEAACGVEALSLARTRQPSLVLLDVKLPDINGMEVCRQLKGNTETQNILVLQTSASFLGSADKIRSLDYGADNYLCEPIEPDELVANVKALLRLGMVERELRETDRRKNEFLATLAHELRNPLSPIRTSVEILRKLSPDVTPAEEKARNAIQRHADHLTRLVDDLLDVSRISQSKIALQQQSVQLKDFIETALESSAVAIEGRGHQLIVDLPEQAIWVEGDPVRLSQVVTNLLRNAAKFTPVGGTITLTASLQKNQLLIQVADTGIGISPEDLDAIFELFAQSGSLSGLVQDGLGIGLSLVKSLVVLHGGQVRAHSEGVDQGSTFEVLLPTVENLSEQGADQGARTELTEADESKKRVLVIDDNVDGADSLAHLLTLCGHQSRAVYNGLNGVAMAVEFKPDLIFLDIGLPDMNGFDVARKLKGLPDMPAFNLIALTGYGQEEDRVKALQAGFDEHIAKPLNIAKLETLGLSL
ncbi:MAG: response regulator [Ketobacter sp.]|nr:MAG: response regulator [Ketobacter sp.]